MNTAQEKPDEKSAEKNQKTSEVSGAQKLIDFLQKNRKSLFIGFLAAIVILAGSIIGISMRDKFRADAYSKVDTFNERYEALRPNPASEDINALLEEITAFAARNSGFVAARAYSLSAGIYDEQERWAEAEKAWAAAARAAPKSYFAPISFFNAAVAAEEQGNIESAIDLYTRVLEYENVFFIAARAQFSVGRLEEASDNSQAALEAYRSILSKWPHDPLWANLAQSRIIVLAD